VELEQAGDIAIATLPLYFHTGELFEVDEARRPEPRSLLPEIFSGHPPG
jgi:hypothetical protein